ncbi:MAG TPA: non-homologous end-joining DNA ligase [Solirubrobacterales bacterium]|nr:non-homologous end-joining DNA ligase [Solirubrobacterales bacterium]
MAEDQMSRLVVGAPKERFPARVEPMLAKMADLPGDEENWGFEIKWDGVRVLAFADKGGWRMQNRRAVDVTIRYPELAPIAEQLANRAVVLDGEVVALDERGRPSFQLIQRRMGLASKPAVRARMSTTPVDYMAFDLLHLDGRCVRDLPYPERRALLDGLGLDGLRWHVPAWHRGGGADLLEAARRQGLEGVVAKRLDSPYRPGRRSGEWIKQRVWQRQEFVIGGHVPGEGRRAETVGSLLVGYYDKRASELRPGETQKLIFAGSAGSGLKQEHLGLLSRELAARRRSHSPFEVGAPRGPKAKLAVWCEPELVCEVQWTEWTNEGTLRQPSFKGMRDDKAPSEVVREA